MARKCITANCYTSHPGMDAQQEEFNSGVQKAGDPQGPPHCPPCAAQRGRGIPGCWHGSSG